MKSIYLLVLTFSIALLVVFTSCNKPPYVPDYTNVKGYVVGKETCNTDPAKDYWLIDLTFDPDTPPYGDALFLNNVTYTNVVKTKDLAAQLQHEGMKVSLDYKTITGNRVVTTGCSVANPVTYPLKELFIINQFEIR